MNVFDFNIHLAPDSSEVFDRIHKDASMSVVELLQTFTERKATLAEHMQGGNIMVFNPDLFFDQKESDAFPEFAEEVQGTFEHSCFTAMINFRRKDEVKKAIDNAVKNGVRFLKVHSYAQRILNSELDAVTETLAYGASKGMGICIDASFGSTMMYSCDNLKLAAHVLETVSSVPVVLLHSGGIRCFEAMLLVLDKPNVFLETSFSIPYYWGSSIIQDFAFCYKKIGSDKILYASDTPFIDHVQSLELIHTFFEMYEFDKTDQQNILSGNAVRLLQNM